MKKAFAVRLSIDLVIVADDESEIDDDMVFTVAREQYGCGGPFLAAQWVKVKRILYQEDIPEGWEDVYPWNDHDACLPVRAYIPTAIQAIAEAEEE